MVPTVADGGTPVEFALLHRIAHRRWVLLLLAQWVSAAVCTPAFAANWTLTPRASGSLVFTDNVRLETSNEKEADFVTTVQPGVSLQGQGSRFDLFLSYGIQAVVRAKTADDLNHRLALDSTGELLKESVFLDLNSTFSQQNASNSDEISFDNVSDVGNLRNVFTIAVSPYWQHQFGSFADATARYTFDRVVTSGSTPDSSSNRVNAALDSGDRFTRVGWGLSYNFQKINSGGERRDGSSRGDTTFQRGDLDLRYLLSRKVSLVGDVGYEDNDFDTDSNERDTPRGLIWNAGLLLTPSPRTELEGRFGKRFYGSTYLVRVAHHGRRTTITGSYNETLSTSREAQLERALVPVVDEFGQPIFVPTPEGEQALLVGEVPTTTFNDEVFIRKRTQGGIQIAGRKTDISVQPFFERREFQDSDENEDAFGANASATRRFSARSDVSLFGGWSRTKFRGGLRDADGTRRKDDLWDAGVALSRRFGENIIGGAEYLHRVRDSNQSSNDFTENRITLRVSVTF